MPESQTIPNVVKKFFKGKPLDYFVENENVRTRLTLQNKEPFKWKEGIDYICWADLKVEWDHIHSGNAGRAPSIEWHPAYFHVNDSNFGGLFAAMHKYAEAIAVMLTHMKESPDVNKVRRCFYTLEDQVRADFDNPEFEKYFVREDTASDD